MTPRTAAERSRRALIGALRRRWPDWDAARRALGARRLAALSLRLPEGPRARPLEPFLLRVLGERRWSHAAAQLHSLLMDEAARLRGPQWRRRLEIVPLHGAPTAERLLERARKAVVDLSVYPSGSIREGSWTLFTESAADSVWNPSLRRRAVAEVSGRGVRAWRVPFWAETPALARRVVEVGPPAAFAEALDALRLPSLLRGACETWAFDEHGLERNLVLIVADAFLRLIPREARVQGMRGVAEWLASLYCEGSAWTLSETGAGRIVLKHLRIAAAALPSAHLRADVLMRLQRRLAEAAAAQRRAPAAQAA